MWALIELLGSFARFSAKLWNAICDELRQLLKRAFEKHINDMLFLLLEAEDNYYDESPILLQKIANYWMDTAWFIQYTENLI